jgi:hypothetical protein
MKTYFLILFNTIITDLNNLYNYLPVFILKYLYILKFKLIELSLNFNIFENYYFFSIYLLFIIISTNYIYKLVYTTICYLNFEFIFDIYISLKQLKFFVILNSYENKFLYNYKNLFRVNLKQFLIGTGLCFFYLIMYQIFIILFEYLINSNLKITHSEIYNNFNFANNFDFFFQLDYINILLILIFIYVFLHILFGLFNIFYDYLKDISFILFFISFFIFFILFNIFLLYINLEIYLSFLNYILT